MKTKSFISEDVIQIIASGYESSQTLISMDVLKKVLNPYEMRNVLGGSGQDDDDDPFTPGTCGHFSGGDGVCCISKSDALDLFAQWGGNWCCDSCGGTFYCGWATC